MASSAHHQGAAESRPLTEVEGLTGFTAAHLAAETGHLEALTALLDAGTPVDVGQGTRYNTLLFSVCLLNTANAAQVVRLLQRGAAVNPDLD